MARGDECYSRVDVAWWRDTRFANLNILAQYIYLRFFWSRAVEVRRQRLSKSEVNLAKIAHEVHHNRAKVRYAFDQLLAIPDDGVHTKPLLFKHSDGSVTVVGVRDKHKRLLWKDVDEYLPDFFPVASPYAPHTGGEEEEREEQEQKEESPYICGKSGEKKKRPKKQVPATGISDAQVQVFLGAISDDTLGKASDVDDLFRANAGKFANRVFRPACAITSKLKLVFSSNAA